MSSFFGGWFSYGVGRSFGQALFGRREQPALRSSEPIRSMTEEEIRADEKRFEEDARRLDEEDRKAASRGR